METMWEAGSGDWPFGVQKQEKQTIFADGES